jgi:hypothetical protein
MRIDVFSSTGSVIQESGPLGARETFEHLLPKTKLGAALLDFINFSGIGGIRVS